MTDPDAGNGRPGYRVLLSDIENRCLTFFERDQEEYYVGYRFSEGSPELNVSSAHSYDKQPRSESGGFPAGSAAPLRFDPAAIVGRSWLSHYEEPHQPGSERIAFRSFQDGCARVEIFELEGYLSLAFYFEPDETGIRLWLKAQTTRALEGSCLLQQCLRFTGSMNAVWRTEIAHVPYLSEFDMHAMGRPNATLTYFRREGSWSQFPVQYTVLPIKGADPLLDETSPTACDHGLIVRESPHRDEAPAWYWDRVAPGTNWPQVSAGLYWERTAKVSNRHPADCVHAWVDIGPLAAGETRIMRGKAYYLAGSKDQVLAEWQRDFPVLFTI